ncbi:hypothetical protein B0T17DRAFT_589279 [Bombardia bombarda]|uniref:ATP-grasp domain-containing protein n=1 Tax=Bombardia bombarda TaxID=252184 RepID=A0AA39X922_9PEZI|nr:hypothetical protein B0T17DRAFT_589279 [Bombardia bombarda]
MALGVLPGLAICEASSLTHNYSVDLSSFHAQNGISPDEASLIHDDASSIRPFHWEVVSLCDLYSVVNIVVLPSPHQKPLATRNGIKTNGQTAKSVSSNNRFLDALRNAGINTTTLATSEVSVLTVILPSRGGYVTCSDFFQLRLQDCPYPITQLQGCLRPLEKYNALSPSAAAITAEDRLPTLIEHAAAVVQWAGLGKAASVIELQSYLLDLTRELKNRLNNAPCLSPQPIARKRVALVRGRPNITAGGPVYRAAEALGLDLVIIDQEGHWLQPDTEENRKHREAFLVTDMTEDSGVAGRIAKSIQSYPLPVHGVFTLSDNFFVTVAQVAETLGLPCNPVSAYQVSVDKYLSRLLQDDPGRTARVTSVKELERLLSAPTAVGRRPVFTPSFPAIVKPTKGWSSEGVSRANNHKDLVTAVEKATGLHGSAAVIEPFFDGPEIDVNLILLNGEVLYSEITDEPPFDADKRNATVNDTFSPQALTLPSALPIKEQDIAKSTLRDILVELGFHTGIFHVEARMVDSSVEYRDLGNGVVDLVPKKNLPLGQPCCRLLEINARPPGFRTTLPSKQTYGVDYFAVHMLACAGDHGRLRLVVKPFDYAVEGRSYGAQYWSRLLYIPTPAAGTVQWKENLSPCEQLKRSWPYLAPHMSIAMDCYAQGEKVVTHVDGVNTYAAYVLVTSRESRRHTIEMGNEVLAKFHIDITKD